MKRLDGRNIHKIKLLVILFVISIIFSFLLMHSVTETNLPSGVVINEICSSNFSLYEGENGSYPDYIELYNASEEAVPLEGYFLSDDKNELQKLALHEVVLQPREHYVVWLNQDEANEELGFGINALGEEIFLSNSEQGIVDSVSVPKLQYNTSYGRIEDGSNEWSEMTATFGASNHSAEQLLSIRLRQPVFSAESGFYEEDFLLEIEGRAGEKIYYTLDGSTPTPDSAVYEGPITISDACGQENVYAARTDLSPTNNYTPDFKVDKATVVRAISYNESNHCISDVETKVYFVGYQAKEEYDGLAVVSLVTDPAALFDAESGIYANGKKYEEYVQNAGSTDGMPNATYVDAEGNEYHLYEASNAFNSGKEWEREATITYFDDAHAYCFGQDVGIRIAGASTRGTPQKSLSVYGRDIYDGEAYFPKEIFPDITSSTFKLRNGGNANADVKITDAFLQSLITDRDVTVQRSHPCVLFINGEYWGVYNIRERYNEEYLWNYYKVNKDNVWIMDGTVAEAGDTAAVEAYDYMMALATECDLTYDDVYAMVAEQIDVQSLIDFCCINLYTDNEDLSFRHNMAMWRSAEITQEEYCDGKWRWMVYDVDDTLHDYSDTDPVEYMADYRLLNFPIVQNFLKNEGFRKQFCITLMDMANNNYAYDKVHATLMEWQDTYGEQMVKDHQRFFDADYELAEFEAEINEMDTFFKNRFAYIMEGLAGNFDLTGTIESVTVTCNIQEGGSVTVNTSQIDTTQEWMGQYYNDFPITLTATAAEGYRFAGWSGDVVTQESTVEVMIPEGGLSLQAIFEKAE